MKFPSRQQPVIDGTPQGITARFAWTAGPATCCAGCSPATSPSSTTSTSTAPRRGAARPRRPCGRQRLAVHLRPLPEPRARAARRAGVLLVDDVGTDVFTSLKDGAAGRVHRRHAVRRGRTWSPPGAPLTADDVAAQMDSARGGLATQLQSFTHNTTEFLRREQACCCTARACRGCHRRSTAARSSWSSGASTTRRPEPAAQRFIREQRPGAGRRRRRRRRAPGGRAQAAPRGRRRERLRPPGSEPDSAAVCDQALRAATRGRPAQRRVGPPGRRRPPRAARRPAQAASPQRHHGGHRAAVADIRGASLIVTVGTHATLDEFLDRQRCGLASTFLTRLRVGPQLVDAKGVPAAVRRPRAAVAPAAGAPRRAPGRRAVAVAHDTGRPGLVDSTPRLVRRTLRSP